MIASVLHGVPRVIGVGAIVVALLGCHPETARRSQGVVADSSGVARGAERVTIVDAATPACDSCAIALKPLATVGADSDTILLRDIPIVERDLRGRIYATVPGASDHELIVYHPNGQILGTVGRHGRGPGEFTSIWDIMVGDDDSLYVGHSQYVSVFDSSRVHQRTFRLAYPPRGRAMFVARHGTSFIITGEFPSIDSLAAPLRLFDASGGYVRSAGEPGIMTQYSLRRGLYAPGTMAAGWDPTGIAWFVDMGYRIIGSNLNGTPDRVIGLIAPAEWSLPTYMSLDQFEDTVRAHGGPNTVKERAPHTKPYGTPRPTERRPRVRPSTSVRDVAVLSPTRLAVLVHVAAADWQNARVRLDTTRYSAESIAEPGYRQQLYDTVIDIVDVPSGTVVARQRFQGTLFFAKDGSIYRPSVTSEGIVQTDLFQLVVSHRN